MRKTQALPEAVPVQKKPTSGFIMDFAEELAGRAEIVMKKTEIKLFPIVSPAPENAPDPIDPERLDCAYPPLFLELQKMLEKIENALNDIESIVNRAEI